MSTEHNIGPLADTTIQKAPPQKERVRYSSWLVTINSNLPVRTGDEPGVDIAKQDLQTIYSKLFAEDGGIVRFIQYKEDGKGEEYIDQVDVQGNMEVGSVRFNLHLHAILSIKHRTRIQMDYKGVKRAVQEVAPFYVNFSPFPNSFAYMLDYINKNQQEVHQKHNL